MSVPEYRRQSHRETEIASARRQESHLESLLWTTLQKSPSHLVDHIGHSATSPFSLGSEWLGICEQNPVRWDRAKSYIRYQFLITRRYLMKCLQDPDFLHSHVEDIQSKADISELDIFADLTKPSVPV